MKEPGRRGQILRAARGALAHDRKASIDDVATAAGVSRATVYRLFGTRARLLEDLELEPDLGSQARVLAAALELVDRDGLAGLSMDELAARAGVSRATLYRLFPGKAALFRELVRVYSPLETVAGIIERSPDRPPEEMMPEIARHAARVLVGKTGILRTMLLEILSLSPDAVEATDWAFARGVAAVMGYVADQMSTGRLRPIHPVVALTGFIGPVLFHLLSRPVVERQLGYEVPVEDTVTQLAENWVRSMQPD